MDQQGRTSSYERTHKQAVARLPKTQLFIYINIFINILNT